jgi:hypothetical protein
MIQYTEYQQYNKSIKYPFSTKCAFPTWFPLDMIIDITILDKASIGTFYLSHMTKTAIDLILKFNGSYEIHVPKETIDSTEIYYTSDTVDFMILFGVYPSSLPNGIWSFSVSETSIESCCIVPKNNYVSKISIGSIDLDGSIQFANGYNCAVSIVSSDTVDAENPDAQANQNGSGGSNGSSGSAIQLDSYPGAGAGFTPCSEEESSGIYRVNLLDATEKFNVSSGNCIEVKLYPETSTIGINDKCEPCCKDCSTRLTDIDELIDTMQISIDSLDSRIDALEPS